jgi:hypothetical protein
MEQVTVVPLVLSATGVVPKTPHKGLKFIIQEEHLFLAIDDGQCPKYQSRLLQYCIRRNH